MKKNRMRALLVVLSALFCVVGFNTGWAKKVDQTIKDAIDDAADFLKKGVESVGENIESLQSYLDNYHWKGILQDEAVVGPATLRHLELNGHKRAVAVRPGERIEGIVQCTLDSSKCSSLSFYRIVLGIKGKGPQVAIGNELGAVAKESLERFSLVAPNERGIYQLRFRVVESLFESSALDAWVDHEGNEPDGTATIGIIVVK